MQYALSGVLHLKLFCNVHVIRDNLQEYTTSSIAFHCFLVYIDAQIAPIPTPNVNQIEFAPRNLQTSLRLP